MILAFDVETTGLPKSYVASMKDVDNWPRVIQLAWAMYSEKGDLIADHVDLIKPDGWTMPDQKFWKDNGFTQAESEEKGIPIIQALSFFLEQVEHARTYVAHNLNFDYNVLGAEFVRANLRSKNKPAHYCTMKEGTEICKLPGNRGYKWPKLIELHKRLFDEGFEGAHDALIDVHACARCYFKLKEGES